MTQSVVLGVGNVLLTDDGVGVHAARQLQKLLQQRTDVQVVDGGTLSFTLSPLLESAQRLIVLDAAQLQASPGTVRTFFDRQFDAFLGKAKLSVHEVSLVDLFDIARLTNTLPAQRVLIAVQPQICTWGESLTPALNTAMAQIVSIVKELLDAWPPQCDPADEVDKA
ncbi:MAG: HyaD/HybD family hydrogenase maturation endopeptidase [Steroidobacteraceae bacterium]